MLRKVAIAEITRDDYSSSLSVTVVTAESGMSGTPGPDQRRPGPRPALDAVARCHLSQSESAGCRPGRWTHLSTYGDNGESPLLNMKTTLDTKCISNLGNENDTWRGST